MANKVYKSKPPMVRNLKSQFDDEFSFSRNDLVKIQLDRSRQVKYQQYMSQRQKEEAQGQ